jgi:hypothetical protein
MLYICKPSNKFDLNQAIRVSHNMEMWKHGIFKKVSKIFALTLFFIKMACPSQKLFIAY